MTSLRTTLRRHPLLAAEWLQLRNRMRRASGAGIAWFVGATLAALALLRYGVQADLERLAAQWPIVLALATLTAMSHVARRRRRLIATASRSWLAAAPIAQADRRAALAIHVFAPLAALASLLSVLVVAAATTPLSLDAAQRLCAALWAGVAVGSTVGWLSTLRRERSRYEASRYTPAIAASLTLAPSGRALSHWPIAQAFAWARPENLRALVVVCLLLGVQAGTSALHGLLIVAAWLLAGYLGGLLAAVPTTAGEAAQWLRSTPLDPVKFGWTLTRRALVHHAIGMLIAALAVSALGSPLHMTLTLGVVWASAIALVYVFGLWRSRR